jgi:hypothetical protein
MLDRNTRRELALQFCSRSRRSILNRIDEWPLRGYPSSSGECRLLAAGCLSTLTDLERRNRALNLAEAMGVFTQDATGPSNLLEAPEASPATLLPRARRLLPGRCFAQLQCVQPCHGSYATS